MRRFVGVVALAVAMAVLPGATAVGAQDCPGRVSPPCPPSQPNIGGEGEVPTGNPTQPPAQNPPANPPAVGGDTATPPANPPAVGGENVTPPVERPADSGPSVLGSNTGFRLPMTGQEISAVGALGVVLTLAGIGLALAGRRRRTHFDTAT